MNMRNDIIQIKRFDFFALRDFNKAEDFTEIAFADETIIAPILEEAPPPPPPVFSQTELEQAKQIAYARGVEEGGVAAITTQQQLEAQNHARLNQQLQTLNAQITEANSVIAAQIETQRQTLAQLAFSVAKKLGAQAIEQNSLPILRDMIAKCLPHVLDYPSLKIMVCEADAHDFWNDINAQISDAGYGGELQVASDENMQRGDIRIEWQFGDAERSLAALTAEIEAICPPLPTTAARAPVATITKINKIKEQL